MEMETKWCTLSRENTLTIAFVKYPPVSSCLDVIFSNVAWKPLWILLPTMVVNCWGEGCGKRNMYHGRLMSAKTFVLIKKSYVLKFCTNECPIGVALMSVVIGNYQLLVNPLITTSIPTPPIKYHQSISCRIGLYNRLTLNQIICLTTGIQGIICWWDLKSLFLGSKWMAP